MYTATRDLMLPTTVTGSWPRPSWYTLGLSGRPLSSGMDDVAFREQFTDALDTVISDQERAGLDILTNGDYHQDPDLGGRSWVLYPVERLAGMSALDISATDEWAYPPGTILNEVMGGWRYPVVEGELGEGVPLEYAKVWRLAQQRTDRPVKIGDGVGAGRGEPARRCRPTTTRATSTRPCGTWRRRSTRSSRALAAAGCKVIQIEEPMLHLAATAGDRGEVDFLVDAFNHEISGLEDVEVWIHTCWGNPNMQKVTEDTSYADAVELYMERAHGDVWTLEFKDNDPLATAKLFDRYDGKLPKKVALGMVSHRTLQVESPDEVGRGRPPGAGAHGPRASRAVVELRLRPPGVQPARRLLQVDVARAGREHRPPGAGPARDARARRRPRAADRRARSRQRAARVSVSSTSGRSGSPPPASAMRAPIARTASPPIRAAIGRPTWRIATRIGVVDVALDARLVELGVIGERRALDAVLRDREQEDPHALGGQPAGQPQELAVAAAGRERLVEGGVRRLDVGGRAAVLAPRAAERQPGRLDVGPPGPVAPVQRQAQRARLEEEPQLVDARDLLRGEPGDRRAALGREVDEAGVRERPDRLAQRRRAEVPRRGELLDADALAGFQLTGQDRGAEPMLRPVRSRRRGHDL